MSIVCAIAVLVAANLVNNRLARGPLTYVLTCVAATAVLLLIARRDGLTRADLGIDAAGLRRGLRWAPVLAGAVLVVCLLLLAVPAGREVFRDARATDLSAGQLLWNVLVRVPLGTVLLEETAFRGVLWAMLRRRWGTARATAGSSALFGLWHVLPSRGLNRSNAAVGTAFGSGSADAAATVAAAVVVTAVAGAFLCELRRRSGSLLAPAALHWAVNGFGYALAWAAPRWWLPG
ncbi:CPBP family intramembrane glutamic endopeptidase [Streptomyces chromofuscus]|uniref:CPBP family intramembrane metalloprotease n=1 Tax=Streptomyces chromofuscus TaxID=42881 RepID=A0A7M2TF13_STRCW|nr:CPBP family intramembrane glutamic endopeptidase [Streptomyces chromofuscus]QOV46814.1 CPBP family intramembrane metalloprotease [Streptomyces chromofuscus]GGT13729.1 abortive infection protein [Streptomyces chromofuscus]